jgi:hypothetical protein
VQVYGIFPSASFVEDHVRVELAPLVTVAGLNEALHVGNAATVTTAEQVCIVPAAFCDERVHVWLAVGEKLFDPLAPLSAPEPRLPVQL